MRQLTQEESAAFAKAEKRRQMAAQVRFRLAAHRGALKFIDDLLVGLNNAPPRTRAKLEPELVLRKGHILVIVRGLAPLVAFFKFAQRQLLDPLLEEE